MRLTDTVTLESIAPPISIWNFHRSFSLFCAHVGFHFPFQHPLSATRFPGQGTPRNFWNGEKVNVFRYRLLIDRRKIIGSKFLYYDLRSLRHCIYTFVFSKVGAEFIGQSLLTNGRIKRIFMETGSRVILFAVVSFFFSLSRRVTGSIFLINPLSSDYFQIYFIRTMFS